jgi:hypothetical protein
MLYNACEHAGWGNNEDDGCSKGDNGVPLQIRVPLKEAASFEFGDATFGMEFNIFSSTVMM